VHPGQRIGWVYAGLLPHLDPEVPVYAVQARGLAGPTELATSVELMADDYLAQIRSVAPTGPYRLLGWSFGGMVAHAVAERLRADGETVELLAILDSYPSDCELGPEQTESDIQVFLAAALRFGGQDPADHARPLRTDQVVDALRAGGSVLAGLDERAPAWNSRAAAM
jgi:thioesterase domain-containing protein